MSTQSNLSFERRNQIINAATVVFAKSGFNQARMDDVAEAAGFSKGTLYWYFNSKDDLIIAILEKMLDKELHIVGESIKSDESATDKLMDITELIIEDLRQIESLMPIFIEFISMATRVEKVTKIFKNYFRKYMNVVVPIIQQGIDNDELSPIDPKKAAISILAIVEGTILLWVYDPENVQYVDSMRDNIQILLAGLKLRSNE